MRPIFLKLTTILLGPLVHSSTGRTSTFAAATASSLSRRSPGTHIFALATTCPAATLTSRRQQSCAAPGLFISQRQTQEQDQREHLFAPPTMSDANAEMLEGADGIKPDSGPSGASAAAEVTGSKKKNDNEEGKDAEKQPQPSPPAPLPKLSAAEFRAYNSMAEHMEYFHNSFRRTWTTLWTAATTSRLPPNLSKHALITTGLRFTQHLSVHHDIEETHIFPVLAERMPEFAAAGKKGAKNGGAAELLRQHKEIHKGMEEFEKYLRDVGKGEVEFSFGSLKEKMESWGTVLWTHLDQEVKTLGAENMRKYWTVEEMRRMPM